MNKIYFTLDTGEYLEFSILTGLILKPGLSNDILTKLADAAMRVDNHILNYEILEEN